MKDNCTATAAVQLMFKYPFWCELFYTFKVIETTNVPTLQTDSVRLWVNPEYWMSLTLEYRITALAHESAHKMLHHCTRGRNFEPYMANIAADLIVNTMLADNGFKIHPSWVQPEDWVRDKTFEQVYHELMKRAKPKPKPPEGEEGVKGNPSGEQEEGEGDGEGEDEDTDGEGAGAGEDEAGSDKPGKSGRGKGKPDKDAPAELDTNAPEMEGDVPEQWKHINRDVEQLEGSPEAIERHEQKVEQQVGNALANAKAAGYAPVGVETAVDANREVKQEAWYDHLARYMQSLAFSEFSYERHDRRQAALFDVVAPDVFAPALSCVVLLIDASGSCFSAAQQANFFGHINDILSETKPKRIVAKFFDVIVHKTVEVDPGEVEFNEAPAGGGGTSFVQPMQDAEEEHPDVIICLTDMFGDFPKEEPSCPVVWASTSPGMIAPFGETILIQ